jgi:hypothetical protein
MLSPVRGGGDRLSIRTAYHTNRSIQNGGKHLCQPEAMVGSGRARRGKEGEGPIHGGDVGPDRGAEADVGPHRG